MPDCSREAERRQAYIFAYRALVKMATGLEEQGLPKVPNLELAALYFQAGCPSFTEEERSEARVKLLAEVQSQSEILTEKKENLRVWRLTDVFWVDLTPLYEWVCNELKIDMDESLVVKMRAENVGKMTQLEEKVKDAEENLGETEVRDALVAKAEYLCNIGDKVR